MLSRIGYTLMCLVLLASATAHARALPPSAPNPGLEVAVRAADAIAEIEVLAGGPFRATARVRLTLKGSLPRVVTLEGFNSINGNTVQNGYTSGRRYIVFLSRTDAPGVYAPLTPTTPRMGLEGGSVELVLGDPPFSLPVKPEVLQEALALLLERDAKGQVPERAAGVVRGLWERPDVESRYLAVALVGFLRDGRNTALAVQAAGDKLLRLRLIAIAALNELATPEALGALQDLLKDERPTVSMQAAEALVEHRHLPALEALLGWARRASSELARQPAGDARRNRPAVLLARLLQWAGSDGVLLPSERICPLLMELARQKDVDAAIAADALAACGALAQASQVDALIELAEDPVFAHRSAVLAALARATLRPAVDLESFRAWWKKARGGWNENLLRAHAAAAVNGLLQADALEAPANAWLVLRAAPAPLALEAAAPLLLDTRASLVDSAELAGWRSCLALPFLLERLAWDDLTERRGAADGLTVLAQRHPRLRGIVLPFLRALLADDSASVRVAAVRGVGLLEDVQALPALVQLAQDSSASEADGAARAIYRLTARTLGHGPYEPYADQEAGAQRLAGWWKQAAAEAWRVPFVPARTPAAMPAERRAELERALAEGSSSRAEAAFVQLFEISSVEEKFWAGLLAKEQVVMRGYGALGLIGTVAPPEGLAALLADERPQAALARAQALPVLAAFPKQKGAGALLAWWSGAGVRAPLPWRRLCCLSFGLLAGEPRSLALLQEEVERAVAASAAPPPLLRREDAPPVAVPEAPLLRAALLALAVREDGTPGLLKALELKDPDLRVSALRAVALRQPKGAGNAVLDAMAGLERAMVPEAVLWCEHLFTATDEPRLRADLLSDLDTARVAAACIFARRSELAAASETREALIAACQDLVPTVRARAATALGKLRHAPAVRPLASLLGDTDSDVSASSAEALAALGDRDACAVAAREVSRFFRRDLRWYRALGLGGGEAELASLLRLSASDLWLDRRAGFEGLGSSERMEALARLVEVFRDADSQFRTMAEDALARQGAAGVAALAQDCESPRSAVRAQALQVLMHMPVRAAVRRMLQALNDPDAGVRALADAGLRRLSDGKDAGFDPDGAEDARAAAARRWPALLPQHLRPE